MFQFWWQGETIPLSVSISNDLRWASKQHSLDQVSPPGLAKRSQGEGSYCINNIFIQYVWPLWQCCCTGKGGELGVSACRSGSYLERCLLLMNETRSQLSHSQQDRNNKKSRKKEKSSAFIWWHHAKKKLSFQHRHSSIWTLVLTLNWRGRNSLLCSTYESGRPLSHVLILLRLPGRPFLFHIVSKEFSVTSWSLLSLWQSRCLGVVSRCSWISHTLYTAGIWKALNERNIKSSRSIGRLLSPSLIGMTLCQEVTVFPSGP